MTGKSPVFVAGLGAITAIGNNVAECLDALQHSRDGIGNMQYLRSSHKDTLPVAEVKKTNEALATMAGLPAHTSRTALLSAIAAREAIVDAQLPDIPGLRLGLISANSTGGMDKTEEFFEQYLQDPKSGHLKSVVNHECGAVTEVVADHLDIHHYTSTISTACSSSANAIMYGARLIRHGILDAVVAGGTDALTRFTLNGFNTLMILDQKPCTPFDENRKGLNLGEGAGYVLLVSDEIAKHLSKPAYCLFTGGHNANDAFHQTASSPEGVGNFLAMKGALQQAGLQPSDISYINLHGTGTANNDASEGAAIMRLFDGHYPPMSSTKAFTGHTLGASGGVEAVFSVLAIKHNLVYPSLRVTTPITALPFAVATTLSTNNKINHVLSNSFGFGGNCSSLVFSRIV